MPTRIGPRPKLVVAVLAAVALPAVAAALVARREVADAAGGVPPTGAELLAIAGQPERAAGVGRVRCGSAREGLLGRDREARGAPSVV